MQREICLYKRQKNPQAACDHLCFEGETKMRRWDTHLDPTGNSPAALGLFRASSSMMVAVRYFVSYLYFKAVSSGKNCINEKKNKKSVQDSTNEIKVYKHLCLKTSHHLQHDPPPGFVSEAPSSAALVSLFHEQIQPPHLHSAGAEKQRE